MIVADLGWAGASFSFFLGGLGLGGLGLGPFAFRGGVGAPPEEEQDRSRGGEGKAHVLGAGEDVLKADVVER